ncbi:hypothetical protein CDD83_885 [Cordyceps sp. RAO-2017]|nr:hypothetical protein CDD83_885 [Cordyceps sp. RAO-2017]
MQATTPRAARLPRRPFCATVVLLALLTAYSFLHQAQTARRAGRDARDAPGPSLVRRHANPVCAEIHSAPDQCDFVRRYCKDADAGLLPYLEFYYCSPPRARPFAFVLLVAWLGLLFTTIGIAASDFFSVNLSTIASILGLSQSLAGVTFLALGNGSPDVFSTFAAMSSNSPSMAVGELLGAASFITGVVAGSMALVREFRVERKTYTRDICFFIVAVGFTMAFLADGQLRFWECWTMIAYYLLYVLTVVVWHWYAVRRKRRLRREGEARSHFYPMPGTSADDLAGEPYRDDPDDIDRGPGHAPPSRHSTAFSDALSVSALSRLDVEGQTTTGGVHDNDDDDDDGDRERMVAAEVTRNMRVLRTGVKRHHNINPIRPSLVGALEFRSALAQLQRESNHQLSPITGRSYSENHFDARARRGTTSVVLDVTYDEAGYEPQDGAAPRRDRALSSGDMPISSDAIPTLAPAGRTRPRSDFLLPEAAAAGWRTPALTPPSRGSLSPTPADPFNATAGGPADRGQGLEPLPKLQIPVPSHYGGQSEMSSPCVAFPRYTDSPLAATPSALSEHPARHDYFADLQTPAPASGPVRWWPYAMLPPPHAILAILFPTLQGWREKTWWDRFLSTICVPTIFLLVITLPVVDTETSDDASSVSDPVVEDLNHRAAELATPAISVIPTETEPTGERERLRMSPSRGNDGRPLSACKSPSSETRERQGLAAEPTDHVLVPAKAATDMAPVKEADSECQRWNRWLVCLQLFTGPLFAVCVLWANLRDDMQQPAKELGRMVLYTVVVSLALLGTLLLTTAEHKRPRFHYLLCFMGFVISIAWISTVAGEVVGVLKAFGIVLGISEALLGLTIFAAGNSIGDLVADITVARLGYPVMALSACFGGPMLNILLGIGIGGVMMMVQNAKREHAKHPEQPLRYGPYRVQVGGTLLISSITLLLILFLLLVLVPINKWILNRKIGWGVIVLWIISTVVSVVIEMMGIWGELV